MKFSLIRADDQLHLEVETFNLEPQRVGNGFELRPPNEGQAQPAHLAVTFPIQHVMEYAGTEALPFPKQLGPIYGAGTTRVVFQLPAGSPPIPFSVAGILGVLPKLALVTDGSAGTVAEAKSPAAVPDVSTAELVQGAMVSSPNGAPNGAPNGTLRGAAAQSSGAGAALLAELEARALARRSAPEDGVAPEDGIASAGDAPGAPHDASARRRASEEAIVAERPPGEAVATATAPQLPPRQPEEAVAFGSSPEAPPVEPRAAVAFGPTAEAARAETSLAEALPGEAGEPLDAVVGTASATPVVGTTALGFPSKLFLSPAGGATRMAHAAQPVIHGGNVELWHSRLARRTAAGGLVELPTSIAAHRALALQETSDPTLSDDKINSPLRTSVNNSIAAQTTQNPKKPATARKLMLSPLGAWLDARGSWPGHAVQGSVQGWRHRMVMGRDHYVQVVQRGRLYPLGHEAVLVSTMERTLHTRNGRVSTLVNRSTIHVTGPEQDYGTPADAAGRRWPWQTVELLTLESPSGVPAVVVTQGTGATRKEAVILNVNGRPFTFDCLAVDRGHRVSTFDLPLVFVPEGFANITGLKTWFDSAGPASLGFRSLDLDGQVVALAPSAGGATPPDTTTVVAQSAPLAVEPGGPLGFRPALPHVEGIVPALARFSAAGGGLPQRVTLAAPYLQHGFNPAGNAGEVLFSFAGPVVELGAGATGGMVAPKFNIAGLSRQVGLVGGDLAQAAAGTFDVRKWLSGSLDSFTLFGVFKLTDLIPAGLNLGANAPRMVTQTLDGLSTQELKWDVPLFGGLPNGELRIDQGLGVARLRRASGAPEARLLIHVQASVDPASGQVRGSALCQVTNLELVLELAREEIVTLPMPLFEFKSVDGRTPDVNVRMGRIGFGGVLRFVETLASLIDHEGLSDPPALEQIPNGIRSSFSAPIPAVAVGMFSLENIVFGAQLSLFFGSMPLELALNFATIDNPFRLTVSALGGGGYLCLVLTTKGLKELWGSLEFGAAISVNLGVARGSVFIMGGISFFIEESEAKLTGYLRVRGEVQVLGLVSISIESTLSLSYDTQSGKVEGAAEWVLRVKVLFFRKTVRVRFEKRFAGANGDPTFAELMAPEGSTGVLPWDTYCSAFAEA